MSLNSSDLGIHETWPVDLWTASDPIRVLLTSGSETRTNLIRLLRFSSGSWMPDLAHNAKLAFSFILNRIYQNREALLAAEATKAHIGVRLAKKKRPGTGFLM